MRRCHIHSTPEIKSVFVDFFKTEHHFKRLEGTSLLDPSVPMTFVMSAGLAQVEKGAARLKQKVRDYILVQNCFRYFDMEQVGTTPYHLSFFRMPGAFSFGERDKNEIVSRIWKLLTEQFQVSKERIWVTYFSGGKIGNCQIPMDSGTKQAWQHVGLNKHRIIPLNSDHNFWKQGASVVGEEHAPKCGPLSEVFFDRGEAYACGPGCLPGCRCGRFVEIMNTLFIRFAMNDGDGRIRKLEEPFTETVIGLERMAMVLQEASSVFGTDEIAPLIRHMDLFIQHTEEANSIHRCIIADHIRAILFLTADGAPPPGKGGRKRLMRKLIRNLLTRLKMLEIDNPDFIPSLVEQTIKIHAADCPELEASRHRVLHYLETEQDRFHKTLDFGYRKMKQMVETKKHTGLLGKEIIQLEKEEGIPIPLIRRFCNQARIPFYQERYETAFREWKASRVG